MKIARLITIVSLLMLAGCGGISIDYLIARAHYRLFPDSNERVDPVPTLTPAPIKVIEMVTPTGTRSATPVGAPTPESARPTTAKTVQRTAPKGLGIGRLIKKPAAWMLPIFETHE